MTQGNQRKIEELVELYTLHPDIRDLFVEGPGDTIYFNWFLNRAGQDNFAVYDITTVDIPANAIFKLKLQDNNKYRLIVLALELEKRLDKDKHQATLIIDRDFDILLKRHYTCTLLLFTDYTCIEMYSFNEKCMDKFLNVFAGGFSQSPNNVLKQISHVLQELFLIRLANETMGLGLEWMRFDRCCVINKSELSFDSKTYIHRYLNSNSMLRKKEEYLKTIEVLRTLLKDDPRFQINGHDYIEILSLYLKKHRIDRDLCNPLAVQRGLSTSIEFEQIIQETLFKNLIDRINS